MVVCGRYSQYAPFLYIPKKIRASGYPFDPIIQELYEELKILRVNFVIQIIKFVLILQF